ncbi:MAG: DsbA family oxidoreductase [Salinisphaera sp.]|jgi:predicted DsbA family dithiol-disulfide isomerase|nr:DsbA family oxidoreductase [Salinisphaera sp.]
MNSVKIDLVSDVVCPWCAIGFARLQQAQEMLRGEVELDVHWNSFLLNPDLPPEGRDMIEHLKSKYGKSETEILRSQEALKSLGEELGLHFEHFLERRSWNTFDTHRVLRYASLHNKDQAMNLALFDAYFGDAENPTDPAVLSRVAESVGLDGGAVRDILAGDTHGEAVSEEVERFRAGGVDAVPSFIVDDKYLTSGAQPPDVIVEGVRQIVAQREAAASQPNET